MRLLRKKSFTIIEALTVIFVFSVISLAFYSAFSVGTKYIIESKNRLGAVTLASEKMESIHNLNYSSIGTKKPKVGGGFSYGIPPGEILEFEEVSKNTGHYYVFTSVRYYDDPTDGIEGGSPDDDMPNDYKIVSVKVAWENNINTAKSITLVSSFSLDSVENNIGGGTLLVRVADKETQGIANMGVRIINQAENIDIETTTDDTGSVLIPGAPAGSKNYEIKVSKGGYFYIETYPAYPISDFNPVNTHASVVSGEKNLIYLVTDRESSLSLETKNLSGNSLENVAIKISGGMKKGDTPDLLNPQPKYYTDEMITSGSEGKINLSGLSFGVYKLEFTLPNYEFIKITPIDSERSATNEININPGDNLNKTVIFADTNLRSVLMTVKNMVDKKPIKNANVNLKNAFGYDETVETDDYGQAFFPENISELEAGNYEVSVSATGFKDKNFQLEVSSGFKKEDCELEEN